MFAGSQSAPILEGTGGRATAWAFACGDDDCTFVPIRGGSPAPLGATIAPRDEPCWAGGGAIFGKNAQPELIASPLGAGGRRWSVDCLADRISTRGANIIGLCFSYAWPWPIRTQTLLDTTPL
jgi:hypothetical protein